MPNKSSSIVETFVSLCEIALGKPMKHDNNRLPDANEIAQARRSLELIGFPWGKQT